MSPCFGITYLNNIKKILKERGGLFLSYANTFELIRKSSAIITINSSIALEALTYYKPVVVTGKAFFKNRGLTYDVDSPNEFSQKILDALNEETDHNGINNFLNFLFFDYLTPGDYRNPTIENVGPAIDKLCG